ncbi:MAG: response regulator, partial [Candidatus Neomarinimicrobiota bacterium]
LKVRAQGKGERILVVEDEPALRSLLAEALSPWNYRINVAENGVEAWQFFQEHPGAIDLIISDLGMPELDGKELARRIHTSDPSVKIIISSGYLEPDEIAELKRYGVQKVLHKPYKLKDVIEMVKAVLGS